MGFVGQWRPHQPREAFNANKMKSPGPKYSLPSTIGCIGHDGGKKKAPSFCFGTRHAKFSAPCSPGPSKYSERVGTQIKIPKGPIQKTS